MQVPIEVALFFVAANFIKISLACRAARSAGESNMGWSTSSPADGVLQVHEQAQGGDVGKANHWNRIQVNPMALQLRSPTPGDLVFLVKFHTFKFFYR